MKQLPTMKQKLFIQNFVANGCTNATQAAIAAGYSIKTARNLACETLAKPYIAEAVDKAVRATFKNIDRMKIRWLAEVERLAYSNVLQVADFDNKGGLQFKNSADLDDDAARTIESVASIVTETTDSKGRTITRTSTSIKQHSKTKALDMLGRFVGALQDDPVPADAEAALDREARRERIAYLQAKMKGEVK